MPTYNMLSAHDRIYSAMSRGALCVTDINDYVKYIFEDGKDIVFYDSDDLDGMVEKVITYLTKMSAGM